MRKDHDPVTLRRNWWHGPEPKNGDVLQTRTGRRYMIVGVRGKVLDCIVIPKHAQFIGITFDWHWTKRWAPSSGVM